MIFKLDLYLGDSFKHELESIFILKLIVYVDLVLENLASIVAEKGTSECTILLNLLLSSHEVLIDALKVFLRCQVFPDAQHRFCFLLWRDAGTFAEACAPGEAAEALEEAMQLCGAGTRLPTAHCAALHHATAVRLLLKQVQEYLVPFFVL